MGVIAWYFSDATLRDGRPIPPLGEWVDQGNGELSLFGFSAHRRIIDALHYAEGTNIHQIEYGGVLDEQVDWIRCSKIRILKSLDGDGILRKFARKAALDVIHLWDAPDVVVQYLKTGDEELREKVLEAELPDDRCGDGRAMDANIAAHSAALWPVEPYEIAENAWDVIYYAIRAEHGEKVAAESRNPNNHVWNAYSRYLESLVLEKME